MKLTIKTLVKLTFQVEIEPDKTVKELKETIEKEQGKDYPSGAQKLIYNGKILADEKTLLEYEFDEKKFIVLMITRAPPVPNPAKNDSLNKANKQKSDVNQKSATQQTQASSATSTTTTTTPATTTPATPASSVPVSATVPVGSTASRDATRQQNPPSSNRNPSLSMSEPQIASRLESLISQPHFRQMQDLIQQSPHLLSSTIESLATSDPELYNFISENPDVFVNAINHPPLVGSRPSGQRPPASQGEGQARSGAQQSSRPAPVVDHVLGNVSEHDKEAIERLKELGFSEYLAVQAYMACDKDEQLAANLLFQMEQ